MSVMTSYVISFVLSHVCLGLQVGKQSEGSCLHLISDPVWRGENPDSARRHTHCPFVGPGSPLGTPVS